MGDHLTFDIKSSTTGSAASAAPIAMMMLSAIIKCL